MLSGSALLFSVYIILLDQLQLYADKQSYTGDLFAADSKDLSPFTSTQQTPEKDNMVSWHITIIQGHQNWYQLPTESPYATSY